MKLINYFCKLHTNITFYFKKIYIFYRKQLEGELEGPSQSSWSVGRNLIRYFVFRLPFFTFVLLYWSSTNTKYKFNTKTM